MLRIRMARQGTKKKPHYVVVVTNRESCRDGKYLEKIGFYYPKKVKDSEKLAVDMERVKFWVGKGAMPSECITNLLRHTASAVSKVA